MKREIKIYLKKIENSLQCSEQEKKEFIKLLKRDIKEYAAQRPDCTITDIEQAFGAEEEINDAFDSAQPEIIEKIKKRNRKIKLINSIIILIFLLCIIIYAILNYDYDHDDIIGQYVRARSNHIYN